MIMKKIQSSQTNQLLSQGASTDWQVLGELELPFGVDAGSVIKAWLSDVLTPLRLHVDFLNRVLESAEKAAARAIQTGSVMKHQCTHLFIYIPVHQPSNLQTWGFFRIEKVEIAVERENSHDHSIEFYLYLEGQ
jgi:hypothetical protein